MPGAALDEQVPGSASTAQTSGANFGGLFGAVNDDEIEGLDDDGFAATDTVLTSGAHFGGRHGLPSENTGRALSNGADADVVVAFDATDIESDNSNEIQ